MRSFGFPHAVGLALILGAVVRAAVYEVAQQNPRSTDEGPGTVGQPWKTIARAAATVGQGDVVVIRGGVYREGVLLKASGTAGAPIRFEAAPGEQVLLTGADQLTGWRKAGAARPIYSVNWPHKLIRKKATPEVLCRALCSERGTEEVSLLPARRPRGAAPTQSP
jgi:hypothetical protein